MATACPEQLLQCNICLDKLNSPRALPCLHSFCEACLQQHVRISHDSDGTTKNQFPCPTCRAQTNLPIEGVKKFPVDFRINQLSDALQSMSESKNLDKKQAICDVCAKDNLTVQAEKFCQECQINFCRACEVKHNLSLVLNSHNLTDICRIKKLTPSCIIHKNEPIKFFCKSCDLEICLFCVLGNHENHLVRPFKNLPTFCKPSLTDCLSHIENQIAFMNGKIFDLTCREGKLRSKYVEEKLAIKKKNKFTTSVEKQGRQLDASYKTQQQSTMAEKQRLYDYLLQFKMMKNRLDVIMQSENLDILLENNSEILKEIQLIDVRKDIQGSQLTQKSHDQLYQCHSDHVFSKHTMHMGDHSNFLISNKGDNSRLDRGYKWRRFTHAKNPLEKCINSLLKLVPPNVTGHEYINARPSQGRLQLYDPAKYRSHTYQRVKLLYKIGGYGRERGKLNLPFGITFLENDILVVAENGNGRIHKFDRTGGSTECIYLQSGYPRCIAAHDNEIFITDEQNKCIKLVSMETQTKINQSNESVHFPYGIGVMHNGNLVVSDMIYERLTIFKTSGEIVLQFGCYGNTNSTFDKPSYIETDREYIYVSDSGHHQVKVFDSCGRFIRKIGNYGSNNGELKYPKGIAFSPKGNLIVADTGNNRIVMFSKGGSFLANLLASDDNIDRPIDVACSSSGMLAVAMPDKHKVHVYKLDETLIS